MGKITAGIFLVNKEGYLLTCHPTNHKSDFWSISKGGMEEDELPIECAVRETEEETNINLRDGKGFTVYQLDPIEYKNKKKILHPFLFLENQDSNINWDEMDIKCNSMVPNANGDFPEMDDFKWRTLNEAEKLLHYAQATCLPEIREIIKNN